MKKASSLGFLATIAFGALLLFIVSIFYRNAASPSLYASVAPDATAPADRPQTEKSADRAATDRATANRAAASSRPAITQIDWKPTFEAAMKEAGASGKPVMIDFYTDWCGWCKKLDKDVYTSQEVITESANFISVKINAEKRMDLATKYKVDGYPHILWLRADGSVIDRLAGYAEAPQFAQMMRSAAANSAGSPV